jgi:hypothetical protein
MIPNLPVKTNLAGIMQTMLLDIADVNGLQAQLNGFVTNPLQPGVPFDLNQNGTVNGVSMATTGQYTYNTPNGLGGVRINGYSFISPFNVSLHLQETLTCNEAFTQGKVYANSGVQTADIESLTFFNTRAGLRSNIRTANGDVFLQPGRDGGFTRQAYYNDRHIASRKYYSQLGFGYNPIGPLLQEAIPVGNPNPPCFYDAKALIPGDTLFFKVVGTFQQPTLVSPVVINWELHAGPSSTDTIFAFSSEDSGLMSLGHSYILEMSCTMMTTTSCQTQGLFTQTDIGTGLTKTTSAVYSGSIDLDGVGNYFMVFVGANDPATNLSVDYAFIEHK